ncbi:hypothetical protein [Mycolicibacterium gilvum]|uniref:hypothetical protein n=1 Tax=Mycolicibacterium gilvum TaxID=1804 RepID=UPI0040460277
MTNGGNTASGWIRRTARWLWHIVLKSRRIVLGARFPTWMRECPDWVAGALTIGTGFTGTFTGLSSGTARILWIVGTAFLAIAAILLAAARDIQRQSTRTIIEKVSRKHREHLENLLGNQLHSLMQLVAEAIATENQQARCALAQASRAALISAAANLVGDSAAGTRANLFRLSDDGTEMRLAPGGFAGRGTRSNRVFRAGHKTFDLALVEQGRFVHSAKDELVGAEREVPYETFITYPVSVGRERLHGVLTVDSLHTGDLEKKRDQPVMAVLSALIAATYECEKYQDAPE